MPPRKAAGSISDCAGASPVYWNADREPSWAVCRPNPFGDLFTISIGFVQEAGRPVEAIAAPREDIDDIDRNRRITPKILDGPRRGDICEEQRVAPAVSNALGKRFGVPSSFTVAINDSTAR